ncbi:MAG: hypothetical protein JST54_01980 [Deltaproteobacteria bacterium]|nr:hypothetical protein [Deltaproteobacteria bacterium]
MLSGNGAASASAASGLAADERKTVNLTEGQPFFSCPTCRHTTQAPPLIEPEIAATCSPCGQALVLSVTRRSGRAM